MSWIDLVGLIMLLMTARHRLFCAIDIFNNGRSCKVSVLMEQTSFVKCLQKAPPHSWQMNKEIVSVKIICYFNDVTRHLTTGKKNYESRNTFQKVTKKLTEAVRKHILMYCTTKLKMVFWTDIQATHESNCEGKLKYMTASFVFIWWQGK